MNDPQTPQLPKDPPLGLLMSMAIRYDHALACPGYYDQPLLATSGVTHAQRLEITIGSMRQLYEEISGHGYYTPEKEEFYRDAIPEEVRERLRERGIHA